MSATNSTASRDRGSNPEIGTRGATGIGYLPAMSNRTWPPGNGTPLFGDILRPAAALGGPAPVFAAVAKLRAEGGRKGLLWLGLSGRATVTLNRQKIMEEESVTRFRVGQFQQPLELRPGENQIVAQLQPVGEKPPEVEVVLMEPANNGDSLEGVRWFG